MRAFIILTNGNLNKAQGMELILRVMFENMGLDASAKHYWEDREVDPAIVNSNGVEYGVRVEMFDVPAQQWQGFLQTMAQPWENYGTVVVRED